MINASSGAVDARYEYDAYGNAILATGTQAAGNTMRFSTKYLDTEFSLYYYGYRYYDPATGRWASRDPLDEPGHKLIWKDKDELKFIDQSLFRNIDQLYVFVRNDALNKYDSLGLLTVHIWTFRGSTEAWGHASLTLEDNTHISWWPSDVVFEQMPFLPMIYTAKARTDQTLVMDKEFEGQDPDVQIKIKCLNEKKIKKWWNGFKTTHKWKTLTQNCSTTVGDALKAGGGPETGKFVWTPAYVEKYARRIQAMEGSK